MSNLDVLKMKVGAGWSKLIEQSVKISNNYGFEVVDVYEKDGQLMFKTSGKIPDKAQSLLKWLSTKSTRVCEECGKGGKLVKIRRSVLARCEQHAVEELYG